MSQTVNAPIFFRQTTVEKMPQNLGKSKSFLFADDGCSSSAND
jgi:hypothetical protein